MGWIWREWKDEDGWVNFWDWEDLGDGNKPTFPFRNEGNLKKTIKTESKVEEVEPGKFIRKCHNVMEITKDSVIRGTTQVVETKTYNTEEDVTAEKAKGGPYPWKYYDVEFPSFFPMQERPPSG